MICPMSHDDHDTLPLDCHLEMDNYCRIELPENLLYSATLNGSIYFACCVCTSGRKSIYRNSKSFCGCGVEVTDIPPIINRRIEEAGKCGFE